LRFVGRVIRQRRQTRSARAHVHVEMERIITGLEIRAAVCDTTVEQLVCIAPHVEQTADVESARLDAPRVARRILPLMDRQAGLWIHQHEPEVLIVSARDVPDSGGGADREPRWARESGGTNCEPQAAGPRGRDHIGVQSHSMTEVEIESLQSQQRPDPDVYLSDSGNHAMAHGCGLDPRTHRVLEHRIQQ
jgi:hypothetical protein